MKSLRYFLLVFVLAACSASTTNQPEQKIRAPTMTVEPSFLPDLGEAPELTNQVWLNTPAPLRLADLRGQVVLLDMWTFG